MNMDMKKKNNKKIIFLTIITTFFINFLFLNNAYAKTINDDDNIEVCITKEAYNEWNKLTKEEKAKKPIPKVCEDEHIIDFKNLPFEIVTQFNATAEIPSVYDPRVDGQTATIKHQMQTGSCWAQSTTTALELYSKKILNLNYTFSPRHIEYSSVRNFLNDEINPNGYNRNLGDGGSFLMSSNYLINSYGPISEEEMPFENNENLIDITQIQNKQQLVDVNNVILYNADSGSTCTTTEISAIKNYILEKGAVSAGIYMSTTGNYYNEETAAYSYIGSNTMDHIVTIVGWDDNYTIDKFNAQNRPLSKGAWIVQNSWGSEWGDNGYFYISYSDSNICKNYMVIDDMDTEIEDNTYSYDKLGLNGYASVGNYKYGYAMNIFTKEEGSEEILKEITIGSNGTGSYKIYYMAGNASKSKIADMQEIGSGTLSYKGYITHKLPTGILLDAETTEFSIAVYYSMTSTKSVIPVSLSNVSKYEYITIDTNKSLISSTGNVWSDLSTKLEIPNSIASIKVSTDDYMNSSIYEIDKENLLIYIPEETSLDIFKTNINASTKDVYKNDEVVTEGNVGTGMKYNNYDIIVKGDVTGDGKVRMNDVMMISKYIVEETGIEDDPALIAADVTKDTYVRMNDVMMISKYIVEGGSL